MKKLLVILSLMFVGVASATTINLDWFVDGNNYAQTTCESGGNLNIPSTTPTKRGYHFVGWIPTNYTQLEYIESTGTQYIDTGIKANSDYSVDIVFTTPSTLSNGSLFGNQSSDILLYLSYGKFSVYNNNSKVLDINTTINTNTTYSINLTVSGTSATISGDLSATLSNLTISGTYNILIGANHNASGNITDYGNFKYNFVKITKVGTLVRDFIPARRKSDNVLGMYDTVSQTFFTNAGTGDFIAGPVSANQTLE